MQLEEDGTSFIPVDAILFTSGEGDVAALGSDAEDDDQPIVASMLGLQQTVLTEVPAKKKRKVAKKKLYFYEVVAEPTGIASKYWDAPAPSVRATKVVAKERLLELQTEGDEVELRPLQTVADEGELPTVEDEAADEVEQQTVDVPPAAALSTHTPKGHPPKTTRKTQVALAAPRNKAFMASQNPDWHRKPAEERMADLRAFTAAQRERDKQDPEAQATKAPARETIAIPPRGKEAVGTLIASEFPGFVPRIALLCHVHSTLTYIIMVSLGFGIHSGKIIALDIDKDGEELYTAEYLDGESEVTLTLTSTLTLTLTLTVIQTHTLTKGFGLGALRRSIQPAPCKPCGL
jgi:hypothetical protein